MMANEDENKVEDLNARISDLEIQLGKSEERAESAIRAAAQTHERLTTQKEIERTRLQLASEQRDAAEKKAAEAEGNLKEIRDQLTKAQHEAAAAADNLSKVEKELTDTEEALVAANTRNSETRKELDDVKKSVDERGKFEKLAKAEFEARTDLREFVTSSLADIMRGVDEAALSAVSRHLESGLLEEPMISPSRVGKVVGGSETLVHFDLAVVASTQSGHGTTKGASGGVGISVTGKLWDQIGLSGTAGYKRHSESVTEERRGVTQDQRIRFSVPLIFASQDELVG